LGKRRREEERTRKAKLLNNQEERYPGTTQHQKKNRKISFPRHSKINIPGKSVTGGKYRDHKEKKR